MQIIINYLGEDQLEKEIKYLEKNKLGTDCLREDNKKFKRENRLILKSPYRFRSGTDNVFTDKIDKIELSATDDTRIQSIDLTETYAYGTKK